jgi:hypothetical protein
VDVHKFSMKGSFPLFYEFTLTDPTITAPFDEFSLRCSAEIQFPAIVT